MSKIFKLLFIIVLFFSFNTQAFSKENFFKKALKLYEKEKYEDALFLFERIIVFNPKDADSYLYLAKIYNHEENQRKEEFNLETALLIEPDNEEMVVIWSSDKLFRVIFVLFFNIFKKSLVTFLEKFKSLPFKVSVNIEAEAKDIAHPSPSKLKPVIFLSLSSFK